MFILMVKFKALRSVRQKEMQQSESFQRQVSHFLTSSEERMIVTFRNIESETAGERLGGKWKIIPSSLCQRRHLSMSKPMPMFLHVLLERQVSIFHSQEEKSSDDITEIRNDYSFFFVSIIEYNDTGNWHTSFSPPYQWRSSITLSVRIIMCRLLFVKAGNGQPSKQYGSRFSAASGMSQFDYSWFRSDWIRYCSRTFTVRLSPSGETLPDGL